MLQGDYEPRTTKHEVHALAALPEKLVEEERGEKRIERQTRWR